MHQTSPVRRAPGRRAARTLTTAVLALALGATAAACGDSDTSSAGTARSTRTVSAAPAESPSASESPRTQQDFAASVSADAERERQRAVTLLKGVTGKGDAVDDVSVKGLPVAPSEQFRSALVRVTNSGDKAAFFAVRVEFVDASGTVLDSVVLGFDDVRPATTVSRHANSRKAAGVKSFPRIAQAERG
ncbi:hypothetical protein [Streptomyces sp. NPDC001478]